MFRKIVIPVSYLPAATQMLHWGSKLTGQLHSDLTLLYVTQPQQGGPINIRVTHEKMTEWGVEPPSFRILREAEELMKAEGIIQLDDQGREVERHSFKSLSEGLGEVHLQGVHNENIRLRLREGPVISEILKEVEDPDYDLVLIGTRGKRGFRRHLLGTVAQDVALQSPCSVLIAKNLDKARAILVGVTGRESSREAVRQGVAMAKTLDLPVRLLAIAPTSEAQKQAQTYLDDGLTLVQSLDYDAELVLESGDPAKTLIQTAGEDHVLALGRTPISLMQRFFLGDISLKILDKGRCSVLIAVPPRMTETSD